MRMDRDRDREVLISLKNVSYTYPQSEKKALSRISLEIRRGEVLLITGPTGAGKTTLSQAASGILFHEYGGVLEGEITILGKDVSAYDSMAGIGKHIGMVFDDADAQLIFTTVEEEVSSGLENLGISREEMQRRHSHVMEVTGIAHLANRAPHALSGGQKQRVAIAATLALGSEILILDEPTAELDTRATEAICAVLSRLREEGTTIVIVEQKLDELSEIADRMILIENGEISLIGSSEEMVLDERVQSLVGDGVRIPVARADSPASATVSMPDDLPPVISVSGLVHRYDEVTALRGVDLTFAPGEIVAVVGENGSGKTTLVKHFNGLLRPTEGSVLIEGRDAASMPTTELARHVGLVFQNPDIMLFEDTVEREVGFGLKNIGLDNQEQRINAVLEEVGLISHRATYPRALSRGERQRLALACVIAMRPKVIVLDEPTTGLDTRESARVMSILGRLQREGHTVIMVTHNMRLVQDYADRIIRMEDGRVVGDVRKHEENSCQRLCSTSTGTVSFTASTRSPS
jgi:energy-coupling factor transport system ATP-binding protein